jgi:hypothetical protein
VRQSSGALQEDEMSARFRHEILCANDNMNRYRNFLFDAITGKGEWVLVVEHAGSLCVAILQSIADFRSSMFSVGDTA